MPKSLLADAFAHHAWATLRLIDACLALSPEQVATSVTGTSRSMLDTMRHLVASDGWDLFTLTGDRAPLIDEAALDLQQLRAAMERDSAAWTRLLETDLEADAVVHEVDEDDGFQRDAPVGIRLAAALHHGNDHRTQLCTTFTLLGLEPPDLSAWPFGLEHGRIVETYPPS